MLAGPTLAANTAKSDFTQDGMADSEGSFFGLKGTL